MEEFQLLLQKSKKTVQIADHMLIMTFPLIKDPKILLAVADNIFLSINYVISSIMSLERTYKRIPSFQDTFESKFSLFRNKIVSKYHIDKEYLKFIQELREILLEHKKSAVEFSRGDRFIICSPNYRMKTVGVSDLKKYLVKTKMFITEMERIIDKNAGIFK